jgi:XTP/dITP diphosphohydrolase
MTEPSPSATSASPRAEAKPPLLLATRSTDKAREIGEILGPLARRELITLADLGLAVSPAELALECHSNFRANARAKAEYFRALTGLPVLADDSGIMVHALQGAPGVLSKRFSGAPLTGGALDDANNALLLDRMAGLPLEARTAHYVCAAVLLDHARPPLAAIGSVTGRITEQPAGDGGFGYDPLFFFPPLGRTFAEVEPSIKNQHSHRARAFRALAGQFHEAFE